VDGRGAVREAALADIGGLRAERDGINRSTIRRKEANGFATLAQREGDMEVGPVGGVLIVLVVGPNQQVAAGRNDVMAVVRDSELEPVGQVVGEVTAAQIGRIGAGVVKLEPVLEIAIGGIGEGSAVVGKPFIDHHCKRRRRAIVGGSRSGKEHGLAIKRLGIRKVPVAPVGGQGGVVQVINDLDPAAEGAGEDKAAGIRTQAKAGVQSVACGLFRSAIAPDDEEPV